MSSLEKYNAAFISVFNVDPKRLDKDFTFNTIEIWDSMTHLLLISELEASFDIMFETEDILHFGGYLNGKEILKRYGVDFEE